MTDKEIQVKVGKRIKEYRNQRGFTQQYFSELVGLTPSYFSDIERGKSFPSPEKFVAIANALGCSADQLFCDVIENSSPVIAAGIVEKISALKPEDQNRLVAIVNAYINSI